MNSSAAQSKYVKALNERKEQLNNDGIKSGRHIPLDSGAAQKPIVLRSSEFRKGREKSWIELENILSKVDKKGIKAISAHEAQKLPLLYRSAMSSLSVARNIVLDRNVLLYLENLSLRAYLVVYGPRTGLRENFIYFLGKSFPQSVRNIKWHFLIALLALLVGILAGYMMVIADMTYFNMLVPESLSDGRGPGSTAEELKSEELFAPWPGFSESFIVFANYLFRHNTMVGLMSFCLGFVFGIPTLMLLFYNGMVLGAFIAIHAEVGLTVDFIGWVSIHGITEILAILLCGAAGLRIAEKIIFPGSLPRLESLATYGRKAAGIVAGAVILFFIAGFIEGGFRQLINNTMGRFVFATLTLIAWGLYFYCVGRGGKHGAKI